MNLAEFQEINKRKGRVNPRAAVRGAGVIRNAIATNAISSQPVGPGGKN
jgi:hypothetical protein